MILPEASRCSASVKINNFHASTLGKSSHFWHSNFWLASIGCCLLKMLINQVPTHGVAINYGRFWRSIFGKTPFCQKTLFQKWGDFRGFSPKIPTLVDFHRFYHHFWSKSINLTIFSQIRYHFGVLSAKIISILTKTISSEGLGAYRKINFSQLKTSSNWGSGYRKNQIYKKF